MALQYADKKLQEKFAYAKKKKFQVTWEVWYFDDDVKYSVSEIEEAKNLEELIEHLDAGKEEGYFTPELKAPSHDGDFNIEYVLIESETGEILWKDPDYEK